LQWRLTKAFRNFLIKVLEHWSRGVHFCVKKNYFRNEEYLIYLTQDWFRETTATSRLHLLACSLLQPRKKISVQKKLKFSILSPAFLPGNRATYCRQNKKKYFSILPTSSSPIFIPLLHLNLWILLYSNSKRNNRLYLKSCENIILKTRVSLSVHSLNLFLVRYLRSGLKLKSKVKKHRFIKQVSFRVL